MTVSEKPKRHKLKKAYIGIKGSRNTIVLHDLAETIEKIFREQDLPAENKKPRSQLNDEEYFEFLQRADLAKKLYKELKTYLNSFEECFANELGYSPPKGRQWILKNKKLYNKIGKYQFLNVYDYLFKKAIIKLIKSEEIFKKSGGVDYNEKANKEDLIGTVLVIPDLDKMSSELKLSKSTIHKYLKAFDKFGVIKRLPKRIEKGGKYVYSIGWWISYWDEDKKQSKPRKLYYFRSTNKELIKRLSNEFMLE